MTATTAGLCSQQLANQPGVSYDDGLFTSLTDRALEMFVHEHAPIQEGTEMRPDLTRDCVERYIEASPQGPAPESQSPMR